MHQQMYFYIHLQSVQTSEVNGMNLYYTQLWGSMN